MKSFLFTIVFFTSFLANAQLGKNGTTNTYTLLNPTHNFSSDQEPSIKKLKKIKSNSSTDETLEYAIYLHDFLYPESSNVEISSEKLEKIGEKQIEIVKEFILPTAMEGNLKAISFLTGKKYLKSDEGLKLIANNNQNIPAIKLIKDQLEFNSLYEDPYNREKLNANRYQLAENNSLKEYFSEFNTVDLIRIRDLIDNKMAEIIEINKIFKFDPDEYYNSPSERKIAQKRLPQPIEDTAFTLKFGISTDRGVIISPLGFDDKVIEYDAIEYLTILRCCIDKKLINKNPISLAQILYDYRIKKISGEMTFDYLEPSRQYFSNDKKYASMIFILLSSLYTTDGPYLSRKTYYLKRAFQSGDTVRSLTNLALIYNTLYQNSKNKNYNDTCIFYIQKLAASNATAGLTMKGIKIFNGDGYPQNKDEGMALLLKAKSLGGKSSTALLETLPKMILPDVEESFYNKKHVNISYPWNFKLLCSNNCGKYVYPDEITWGRTYKKGSFGAIEVGKFAFFSDDMGNAYINISEDDFKQTFNIIHFGRDYKTLFCSDKCKSDYSKFVEQNDNQANEEYVQFQNETIKCAACSKQMKRKDMLKVTECPCYTNTGSVIYQNLTKSSDLFNKNAPRVCSSACQINYCKISCTSSGYESRD